MPRLDRYLLSLLAGPFSLALVAFLSLTLSSQLLKLVSRQESPALSPLALLELMLYFVPALAGMLIPAALLTALLTALGRLGADGELLALSAAGISPWRLLRPLLLFALACSLATTLAGSWGEPWGRRQLRARLADLHGETLARALSPGIVQPLLPGITLLVARPPAQGLLLADDRTADRHLVLARDGDLHYDRAGRRLRLRLEDGELLHPAADGSYQRLTFQRYHLELPLPPLLSRPDLAELYSDELRARITRLEREGRPTGLERVALARRLAYPAACPAFAIAALPLGSYHGRAPRARGYLLAAALLLSYYLLIRAADAYGVDGSLPPALAVWLPNLLLTSAGLLALWRRGRSV